jgi:hypothetical protein
LKKLTPGDEARVFEVPAVEVGADVDEEAALAAVLRLLDVDGHRTHARAFVSVVNAFCRPTVT